MYLMSGEGSSNWEADRLHQRHWQYQQHPPPMDSNDPHYPCVAASDLPSSRQFYPDPSTASHAEASCHLYETASVATATTAEHSTIYPQDWNIEQTDVHHSHGHAVDDLQPHHYPHHHHHHHPHHHPHYLPPTPQYARHQYYPQHPDHPWVHESIPTISESSPFIEPGRRHSYSGPYHSAISGSGPPLMEIVPLPVASRKRSNESLTGEQPSDKTATSETDDYNSSVSTGSNNNKSLTPSRRKLNHKRRRNHGSERFVWTPSLRRDFVTAIFATGLKKYVTDICDGV
jgi:hypothetical protein